MPGDLKRAFLTELTRRFGSARRLPNTQSLYETAGGTARVYIRYSKVHAEKKTFFGLRHEDLKQLEGHAAFICFLWDSQAQPLLVPYAKYEDLFSSRSPARDGQHKVQVYLEEDGTELFIARAGRFSVDAHFGWEEMEGIVGLRKERSVPDLSHSQVQTMLGAIGARNQYDLWIPLNDRPRLDWHLASRFACRESVPSGYQGVQAILEEVDVIWVVRGSGALKALFEVEYSTPVYSGLLRLNDVHLAVRTAPPRLTVVSNDARRGLFARQVSRPTFQASGLSDVCSFLDYGDVFAWFKRETAIGGAEEP